MIKKIILSNTNQFGGLNSYCHSLSFGFKELGYEVETRNFIELIKNYKELTDDSILKIFSTKALFLAPFSRNVICMAHGIPRLDCQSILTVALIISSLKIFSRNKNIFAVSNYVGSHLKSLYNVRVKHVIKNPLDPIFFNSPTVPRENRKIISYVGRLHESKNIDKLIPALLDFKKKHPDTKIVVAGDGPLMRKLRNTFEIHGVEFWGKLNKHQVKELLGDTRVFISGCETEGLGLSYIEALSQGCAVVMPLSGGGLEIVDELNNSPVQCFPLNFDSISICNAIEFAYNTNHIFRELSRYHPKVIAQEYLQSIQSTG